ncbi:MAG: hypothetical protein ABSD96_11890 [Candidatus Korobacteraceae bacterium]|jgi:hypothetical protein
MHSHGLPHNGLYSQSSDAVWIASSWGYDLLLAFGYRLLELRSIPALHMCFKVALAVVTFLLAGGLRGSFWPGVALSTVAQYILVHIQPSPSCCSIVLLAVELLLLSESRRTGGVRALFWLPPIFLLWANLHVQFVYGVVLLLLFLATSLLEDVGLRSGSKGQTSISPKILGIVTVLCLIASLITPYFYHPYEVFLASVTSAANPYFLEFRAMGFRQAQDYVLLLLTMAAFVSLGRRRSRDPFQISLLIGCAVLSFHARRDLWLVTLAAVLVIGEAFCGASSLLDAEQKQARTRQMLTAAALTVAALILAVMIRIPTSREALLGRVAATYPVAACNYIREHHLPQPLFNPYEWGGFLTWYLPKYPVAIDDRTDLYGDDFMIQYSKVMNADLPYTAYPPLAQAATILLQRNSLMDEALRTVPAFKVAYSDNVAVVLMRKGSHD